MEDNFARDSTDEGWRNVREYNGLPKHMDIEDPDISPLLTDGSGDTHEYFVEEYEKLENDAWALHWLCKDLEELHQEEGEYWILQLQDFSEPEEESDYRLRPIVKIDEEQIYIDSSHGESWIKYEDGDQEFNLAGLVKRSGHGSNLMGRDYTIESVDHIPRVGGKRLEKANLERIVNSYVAPGFGEIYREKAEDSIDRLLKRN